MGFAFSKSMAVSAATGTIELPVAADTLQEVLKDLDRAPQIVGNILANERIRGEKFEVGTRWREVRYFQKREVVIYKTITSIRKDPHFTVCANVDLKDMSWEHKQSCETVSISIIPVNDKSCIVLWSIAFAPAGVLGKLSFMLFGSCMISAFRKHVDQEFKDYAAAGLNLQTESPVQ